MTASDWEGFPAVRNAPMDSPKSLGIKGAPVQQPRDQPRPLGAQQDTIQNPLAARRPYDALQRPENSGAWRMLTARSRRSWSEG
jgi:hypothetical protein